MQKEISQKEKLLEHFSQVPVAGVDLGDGCFETEDGVIRTPKSKLKKAAKSAAKAAADGTQTVQAAAKPEPVPTYTARTPLQTLVFKTPVGEVYGQYSPVICVSNFVVLGLSSQSFIPKAYSEDKDMRLQLTLDGEEKALVYTGCRFKDTDTGREYIILMEV